MTLRYIYQESIHKIFLSLHHSVVDLSQGLSQLALGGGKTEKRRRLNLPHITSAQRQLSSSGHPPQQQQQHSEFISSPSTTLLSLSLSPSLPLPPSLSLSLSLYAGSTVTHLPPLSVGHIPIQTGSGCGLGHGKRRSHCMRCGKKTGLASTYTCRYTYLCVCLKSQGFIVHKQFCLKNPERGQ